MQHSYKQPCAPAQDDIVDLAQLIAEIDAIVCAQIQPEPIERQIAGLLRTLDGIAGITPVTVSPPMPANDDAPDAPAPAGVRKKPNPKKSRRDPLADQVFVGECLREAGVFPLSKSVSSPVLPVPGSPSPSTNLAFLEKKIRTAPTIPGTTTKHPSEWRYLSDEAQAIFAFIGLQDHGPVIGCSSHLSPEINATAYTKPAPASWLHARVKAELDKAFARPVDFELTFEETRASTTAVPKIHVHIVLGLDLSSRRRAARGRAALLRAFGRCTGKDKRRQFRFSHNIDVGWASYIAKDTRWATPSMRQFLASIGRAGLAPSFAGPVMTMTHNTTRLAKVAHENARQIVIEARQRLKTPEASPMTVEIAPATRAASTRSWQRPGFTTVTPRQTPRILPIAGSRLGIPPAPTAHRSRGPPRSDRHEQSKLTFFKYRS